MADRGARLPLRDVARIARTVNAYEAGEFHEQAIGKAIPHGPVWSQWMLLEPFGPRDVQYAYGRRFSAQALQLQPAAQRVQLLRLRNLNWPDPTPFRLEFNGQQTGELLDTLSAEQLQAALQSLPGLENRVTVVGHQSELVAATPDAEAVTYTPRQWHLLYADELESPQLPALASGPHNLRLFEDWWFPTPVTDRVWAGLPGDSVLEIGAFGYCYPLPVYGWTWLFAECWQKDE